MIAIALIVMLGPRVPVEIDIASELRYREAPLEPGGLAQPASLGNVVADRLFHR